MDIKNELLNFLKKNQLMTLATSSETGPWAANVFYTVDDNFNIYFISAEIAKHVKDIEKNSKVALAIANTDQKFYTQKIGVQITGIANKIEPQSEEYQKGLDLVFDAIWGYKDEKLLELNTVKHMVGALFKIKIVSAKFLDETLFGEHVSKEIDF